MRYCPSCHSVYPNEFRTCPKDQAELLSASELQPGMVLRGKYEILARLGAGGMATVYRARHLAFDELRAIKVVASRLADDENFLRRFRNEAVVARRLQHPHAVRVDDFDTTEDGRPFIVMEHVEGENLREVIRREGALGLRRSVEIARQVTSALSAAHDLGIVHRDIKPDNILLSTSAAGDTVKVLDFGIAKVKEGFLGEGDHVATRTGTVVGTPQYISPEQAMGRRGDELDGRADIYSLGVVLYEMVTGRLPFESDTAMGIILQHLQTPPTPPHELRPDLGIPEPLSAVLLQALQKDRDRRFRSAAALVAALDGVLGMPLPEHATGVPLETPATGRPLTPRPLTPRPETPRPETPRPLTPRPETPRPLTPQPVAADIEDRETRVMPRTPPEGARSAALPAIASPPPGMPFPTAVARGTGTPVPQPTIHLPPSSIGGRAPTPTGLSPATPPPLLPTSVFPAALRPRRRRWVWVLVAFGFFIVFGRRGSSPSRPSTPASASPAADTQAEDTQARDDRVRAAVQRALNESRRTRGESITVEVDDGEVTLGGRVRSPRAAKEAEGLTRRVPGVTEVKNEIEREGADDEGDPSPPDPHVAIPPLPDLQRVMPTLPPEAVREMLREGHRALAGGQPDEALAIFGAVLSLAPRNVEARQGMQAASRLMRERSGLPPRQAVPGRGPAPPPPPSPASAPDGG